jgi:hypothetical protein
MKRIIEREGETVIERSDPHGCKADAEQDDLSDLFGPSISSYSRAQAIDDGTLIDVSESDEAKQAGFVYPVAMTRTVWDRYVEVPEGVACQDLHGRLWDILWLLRCAIKRSHGDRIGFIVYVRNDNRRPKPVDLYAVVGPGDDAEPVITIMEKGED